jgi:hypothetical protein
MHFFSSLRGIRGRVTGYGSEKSALYPIIPIYSMEKRHIFLPRASSQAELKQKGKDTCPFPFVASICMKRHYRPSHLDSV